MDCLWNRAVAIDANHAPGEIAADIRVVCEVMLYTIKIRIVKAEAIRASDEKLAIRRDYDAALTPPSISTSRFSSRLLSSLRRARATRSMPRFMVRRSASDFVQTI